MLIKISKTMKNIVKLLVLLYSANLCAQPSSYSFGKEILMQSSQGSGATQQF